MSLNFYTNCVSNALTRNSETQTWQEVETLLQGYSAKAYDEATALLKKLQQLAEFQETQILFQQHVHSLAERFKGRTSLIACWKAKGWV